jgi:hypothetical protein
MVLFSILALRGSDSSVLIGQNGKGENPKTTVCRIVCTFCLKMSKFDPFVQKKKAAIYAAFILFLCNLS